MSRANTPARPASARHHRLDRAVEAAEADLVAGHDPVRHLHAGAAETARIVERDPLAAILTGDRYPPALSLAAAAALIGGGSLRAAHAHKAAHRVASRTRNGTADWPGIGAAPDKRLRRRPVKPPRDDTDHRAAAAIKLCRSGNNRSRAAAVQSATKRVCFRFCIVARAGMAATECDETAAAWPEAERETQKCSIRGSPPCLRRCSWPL